MFTITEWGKLHHTEINRDFLPTDDLTQLLPAKEKERALGNPSQISRFLSVHYTNPFYLFCSLTHKKVNNQLSAALNHVDGWCYKRKMYEFWR